MRQVERLKKPLGEWCNRNQWEIIQQLSLSWLDLRNNFTQPARLKLIMKGRRGGPNRKPLCLCPSLSNKLYPHSGSRGPSIALTVGCLLRNTVHLFCSVLPICSSALPSLFLRVETRCSVEASYPWKNQHQTSSREIPQNITLTTNTEACFARLKWNIGSHIGFSHSILQPSMDLFPPCPVHSHPPSGGNVNTRQLPSTQHHRIALHATVPLHSPTSPSRRIYISPCRSSLLSQAISMGLGQLWSFQPPVLQIPRSRLQADQLRLAGTSLF